MKTKKQEIKLSGFKNKNKNKNKNKRFTETSRPATSS